MKKDIEWLKEEMDSMHRKRDLDRNPDEWFISKTALLKAIDQLDKPEVLSEEWIESHTSPVDDEGRLYVWKRDLQNAIVPKQELPAIPKFVAEWINEMKQDERPLYSVMSSLMNKTNHEWAVWKSANKNFSEIVAQAWLDGYTAEEAPLYYAKSNLTELPSWSQGFDDAYYFGARGEDRHWQIYLGRKAQVLPRTKANWSELNVDDSIAIFELAEEDLNEKER